MSISEANISTANISCEANISTANISSEAKILSVKFEYSNQHYDRIFAQPLFYIAMNIKNKILQQLGKPYYESMLSANLQISISPLIKLEATTSCLNETDFKLNYIMDRYDSDIQFTYKDALFHLKTDKTDVKMHSLKIGHSCHTVTSVYEIKYDSKDIALFEDFIKNSILYFKKFADDCKMDKKRLKLYISSDDGGFFESIGSRPKRSLESVFLPKDKKTIIIDLIGNFLKPTTIQRYEEYGINHKLTILFEGIPGTGKSSLIAALASHFNLNIAIISFTPKMTDVGFMRSMRSLSQKMNRSEDDDERDTLLVIEDMDCIFKERKSNDENRNMVTFSGILNTLDGITTSENQIVIMTTNHIEHLDPALIRPGRVDHIMRFDYAIKEQIKDIFTVYTKNDPNNNNNNNNVKVQEFYEAVQKLNIKITTSLLQQYLLKYANNFTLIMENMDEMKTMYEACNKEKETKMYS